MLKTKHSSSNSTCITPTGLTNVLIITILCYHYCLLAFLHVQYLNEAQHLQGGHENVKRTHLISIAAIIMIIFNLWGLTGCSSRQAIAVTLIDTAPKALPNMSISAAASTNPGFYPLKNNDDVETLVKAAEASKTAKVPPCAVDNQR